jgi:hypothetical protein
MSRINYTKYQPFQDVFQKLSDEDQEAAERGVKRFLKGDGVIVRDHGTEELPSVSTLSSCLDNEFVSPDIPFEMTSFGSAERFVSELEWALVDVHDFYGYDPWGLPRVIYNHHGEFSSILNQLPDRLKELIIEKFGSNDPSWVEYRLRDRDGYINGDDFATWCFEVETEADPKVDRLIDELGEAVTAINEKVATARSEAVQRGELPYADGHRPGVQAVNQ